MIFGPQYFYAWYSVKPQANRCTTMLDVTCCVRLHTCTLLHVVGSCRAKFETGQTFEPKTPNISFALWSLMHSVTMLDPFAQFFPTLLGLRTHITNGLRSLMSCIPSMMHCWEFLHHLHTTAKRMQQLPIFLAKHCWELLHPFASNFRDRRV